MTLPLHSFEKIARSDHSQEHAQLYGANGQLVVARSGDYDSVAFSSDELEKARNGTLTHGHPRSLPLSAADLAIAAEYGLKLRAVGTDETGKKWDYTIRFNNPSVELAQSIKSAFDEQVEIAEKELSTQPMSNRAWARESRHLALVRLSKTHDLNYDRVQINAPVSEMGRHEVKRLDILTHAEKSVKADWLSPLADSLGRIITNHADEKGKIPAYKLEMIRRQISALVQRSFLGSPDANGALMPYTVLHGQVAPRSVYFKTLWGLMIQAATAAVGRHAEIMRKYLPDDLIRQFENATISPFDQVQEIGDFNPLHLFIGSDGKGLIDRIWNAAGDMAGRIDKFIAAEVLRDLPASTIAQDLFNFLLPNKGSSLGRNGSFFATRLARTEISAAYFRADSMAAQLDPMVETYSPYTAPEHACCDECDLEQANGPYEKADMSHLPPFHANCVLPGTFVHVPGEILAATQALYVGECIKITTRSGLSLSVTPNHPILTSRGWTAADLITESDQVMSATDPNRIALGVCPDNDHMPTLIEEIFGALKKSEGVFARRMPCASEDFHSDAQFFNGDVEIVYVNRALLNDAETTVPQPVSQLSFSEHDAELLGLNTQGMSDFDVFGFVRPSERSMGSFGHRHSSLVAHSLIHDRLAFIKPSDVNAAFNEKISDGITGYPALTSEFIDRFASEVILDDVVSVSRFPYSGHVYDLQVDPYRLYISNGIITHNCICGVTWNLVDDIPNVIERLRRQIQNAISNARRSAADVIGPLSKRFIAMLFGGG